MQLSDQVVELSDDQIMSLAKGCWQREILRGMLRAGGICNPISNLRGTAKSYSMRYEQSWRALRARLVQAGVSIERTPGTRGGEYSAVYRIARHA